MPSVSIDVDIDEFDDDDIIRESIRILNDQSRRKYIKEQQLQDLKSALVTVPTSGLPEKLSLGDVLKNEILMDAFNKYSLAQLEEKLK